jgi:hypothetical protein
MRIRTVKPEFWRSADTAALDYFTRLLFIGLWNYVDHNGVGEDDVKMIRADLFPRDEPVDEVLAKIQGGLAELSKRGQITRYGDPATGRQYLDVTAIPRTPRRCWAFQPLILRALRSARTIGGPALRWGHVGGAGRRTGRWLGRRTWCTGVASHESTSHRGRKSTKLQVAGVCRDQSVSKLPSRDGSVTRASRVRRASIFRPSEVALTCGFVEPMTGIEPAYSAWEAASAHFARSLVSKGHRKSAMRQSSGRG